MSENKYPVQTGSRINAAAEILLQARLEPCGRLSPYCRPQSVAEAQAVQHAVLEKASDRIGGWKVGRIDEITYSALLPASSIAAAGAEALTLPEGTKIELELATQFHERLSWNDQLSSLRLDDLPSVAEILPLFEFVRSRFRPDAGQNSLEKIADNVSTARVVTGSALKVWTLQSLLNARAVLHENDIEVAVHDGPHLSSPLAELFETWKSRCIREQLTIERGQLITWGSLTGVRPVPASEVNYIGCTSESLSVQCRARSTLGSA